jgi:hypothetical protein
MRLSLGVFGRFGLRVKLCGAWGGEGSVTSAGQTE